jgi:hypothetical protein
MSTKKTILPSLKTDKVLTPRQIAWRAAKQKEVELWESGVNDAKREIYRLRLEEADIKDWIRHAGQKRAWILQKSRRRLSGSRIWSFGTKLALTG